MPSFFTCQAGPGSLLALTAGREPVCAHRQRRKHGFYRRQHDGQKIQRYLCLRCHKSFSATTGSLLYRARRPRLFAEVYGLFNVSTTIRRSSLALNASRESIARYLRLVAVSCQRDLQKELAGLRGRVASAQFDDLETHVHSKLKPLSVTLAVEASTRKILAFSVGDMPAKGLLAKTSREKYGPRPDQRPAGLEAVLLGLKFLSAPSGFRLASDRCPRYRRPVARHFPDARYTTVKGRRGCVTGQGELKRGGFDPLFALNHTCAMLRAGVSRLFRTTWNTTKKAERLFCHLLIYAHFHNFVLLKKPSARY